MLLTLWHGSNSRFDKFDQNKARIANDFYGGGVAYFTDDKDIAKQYARGMSKKTGAPVIYQTEVGFGQLFDVNHSFTGKELKAIIPDGKEEEFARGAGLLHAGVDKYLVLARLYDMHLTGDQVFKGLSRGMVNTAAARKRLIELGYDGLRYNGGINMGGKPHNVFLAYNASQIAIRKRIALVSKPSLNTTGGTKMKSFKQYLAAESLQEAKVVVDAVPEGQRKLIAATILNQIKGLDRNALPAWAAKNFLVTGGSAVTPEVVLGPGIQFDVRGSKFKGRIIIGLNAHDLYDIAAFRVSTAAAQLLAGTNLKVHKHLVGIPVENLVSAIDGIVG